MRRQLSPYWALFASFIAVPLTSVLNCLVVFYAMKFVGQRVPTAPDVKFCYLLALFFSAPLGIVTFSLIQCWNAGHAMATRFCCGAITVVAFMVWRLYGTHLLWDDGVDKTTCALLFLPFVWTLLFPLFALCAREPKRSD